MTFIYKILFLLPLALFVFAPNVSYASDDTLILTQKNGADMFMACVKLQRQKKIDAAIGYTCRTECSTHRKQFNGSPDIEARAESSKKCRAAYKSATGEDIVPTLPKDYVTPKTSPRG